MPVLFLNMQAPLMSFGDEANFIQIRTRKEPSKSAVFGMIRAALGVRSEEKREDIDRLKMAVRVEKEGKILSDYHIAQDVPAFKPSQNNQPKTVPTDRYFLSDAHFLVLLESNNIQLLEEIEHAVQFPKFTISFGRKCCLPSAPLIVPKPMLSIVDVGLDEALKIPLPNNKVLQKRVVQDLDDEERGLRIDQRRDVCIDWVTHTYKSRYIKSYFVEMSNVFI
jgi:CRISPR system Cascade subunit CasD